MQKKREISVITLLISAILFSTLFIRNPFFTVGKVLATVKNTHIPTIPPLPTLPLSLTPCPCDSPTPTPTKKPKPTCHLSPSPTPTQAISPTVNPTLPATATPIEPTPTPTATSIPEENLTPLPTFSPSPTLEITSSPTPLPTQTPTPGPTSTPQPAVGGAEVSSNQTQTPVVESAKETGEVLGISQKLPKTGNFGYSQTSNSSANILKPNSAIFIPKISVNNPLYLTQSKIKELFIGEEEVVTTGDKTNAVFFGHNYSVFARLDELSPGDLIYIKDSGNINQYKITSVALVSDDNLSVLRAGKINLITLVTCDKSDENMRLVITAVNLNL